MSRKQPYSIGLDIGTNSVGWAVVQDDMHLMRHKRQNMWGSRLFDEAKTAAERRVFRSTRRRMDRRKRRIALLRNFFAEEMNAVDSLFFMRLNNSMLFAEDKTNGVEDVKSIIFGDLDQDKQYKQQYPTIYHLRQKLYYSSEKQDIRLVYLALHHIIKYRGHFLIDAKPDDIASTQRDVLMQELSEYVEIIDVDAVVEVLLDKKMRPSEKKKTIVGYLSTETKKEKDRAEAIAGACVGLNWTVKAMFGIDTDTKAAFSSSKYEEQKDQLAAELGDDYQLVDLLERIYMWVTFSAYLKEGGCLSDGMVELYDDYAKDLAELKELYKEYAPDSFKMFFKKSEVKNTYAAYQASHKSVADINDLYKTIKKDLGVDEKSTDARVERMMVRMANGKYLLRQRTRDNGAIPHQIHQMEFEQIIDNQAQYYPFLRDEREKLISIMTFRLPYWCGPLKVDKSLPKERQFGWVEKKADGEILPWNFAEKVDEAKTANAFIQKMRNMCTYLPEESVLPKMSLLYAEFELRNELKNIKLDGKPLSVDVQNRAVEELFRHKTSVSASAFKKWLFDEQLIASKDIQFEGTSNPTGFASKLKAYNDFRDKIRLPVADTNKEMIEKIIEWVTLFEDKRILRMKLAEYSDQLSDEQVRKITNLTYAGWGRMSRTLLAGITTAPTAECPHDATIMDIITSTKHNFMQIINNKRYDFKQQIEDAMRPKSGTIEYKDIKELAGSPALKRGLWQSVKVIDEIVDIVGYAPSLISIEMAREEDLEKKGKLTSSRFKTLEKMYAELTKQDKALAKGLKSELKEHKNVLSKQKFFLYFMQMGKCAYSGEPIVSLEDGLLDCDVEHIIPRAFTTDNSIDNTVLVKSKYNRDKSDTYPLADHIQDKMANIWQGWRQKGYMTVKKYTNLTRTKHLTEDEQAGFISRQLVETRQITKHLATLLSEKYANSDTRIFTIRAGMSSNFRRWQDIPKCREINDMHHAKDAYLAACIAGYIRKNLGGMADMYEYGNYKKFVTRRTDEQGSRTPQLLRGMQYDHVNKQTGEITWQPACLDTIVRTMWYNDCLVTRKVERPDGKFYKITIEKASDHNLSPRKQGLSTEKYGGYIGENIAFCMGIEQSIHGKKTTKTKRVIVGIPIQVAARDTTHPGAINEYLKNQYGDDVRVIIPDIPRLQKIIRNGSPQYLVGASEVCNAQQMILPRDIEYAVAVVLNGGIPKVYPVASDIHDQSACQKAEEKHTRQVARRDRVLAGLDAFYDVYIAKLEQYYQGWSGDVDELKSELLTYKALTPEDKVVVIRTMLPFSRANSANANMTKIESFNSKNSRFGRKSNQSVYLNEVVLLYESITGLHSRKIDGKNLI